MKVGVSGGTGLRKNIYSDYEAQGHWQVSPIDIYFYAHLFDGRVCCKQKFLLP